VFHPPTDVEIMTGDVITVECEPGTLKTLHGLNRTASVV
jgi:hypothetical protein